MQQLLVLQDLFIAL